MAQVLDVSRFNCTLTNLQCSARARKMSSRYPEELGLRCLLIGAALSQARVVCPGIGSPTSRCMLLPACKTMCLKFPNRQSHSKVAASVHLLTC